MIIETAGLTKYYGKTRGIEDLDLTVEEGEIFGFIGPNGAGKSTTIRTLLNFIFPSAGQAFVFGRDAVKESRIIRRQIGYLPAEVGYYDDMSVGEILAYSDRFYQEDCRGRALELVELFDLDPNKGIHSLSQGNKKKVGIILCLMHQPRLLILDEPTGGLDPLMQKHFFELLREENKKGVTIFFSSHILSEVERLCHRVAIIKEGKILKIEEIDRLRRSQFVRVRFGAKEPAPQIPGVVHTVADNGNWELLFNGDVNRLVHELAKCDLTSLLVEEPTLEEVFMHYYEKEDA